MTIRSSQVDDEKMGELILYLATKSERDPRFSLTKLNKLLFYCDFTAYRQLGSPITGFDYQKLPFGPAPRAMLPILDRMKGDQDCVIEEGRVIALRPPRTSAFKAEELSLADQIVADLWESDAAEANDLSLDFIGWRAASVNEVIPYETVLVGDPAMPVSEEEIEFCRLPDSFFEVLGTWEDDREPEEILRDLRR